MQTSPARAIGFRSTQPFGTNPQGVGWRAWAGPLLIARTRGHIPGVRVSWTR